MPTVATVPVWDRINDSAGNPIPNIDVFVTLNFNQATSASPVTNVEAVQQKVTTDPTGTWTVNVVPVNKLSPSGCVYNVRTPYQSYDINPTDVNVPVGPPAGWQSSTILVTTPPSLAPSSVNVNVSGILTAGSIQVTAGEPESTPRALAYSRLAATMPPRSRLVPPRSSWMPRAMSRGARSPHRLLALILQLFLAPEEAIRLPPLQHPPGLSLVRFGILAAPFGIQKRSEPSLTA